MSKKPYTYHIDLDERGYFNAHVENTRGRSVIAWELPNMGDFCARCNSIESECECEGGYAIETDWDILSPDWGIMRHKKDVDGLGKHLREIGIIPQGIDLVLGEGTR